MKIRTSTLMPPALNWVVANIALTGHDDYTNLLMVTVGDDEGWKYNPSTDWAQGGPIIEMERIELSFLGFDEIDEALPIWNACKYVRGVLKEEQGPTPLIAAMRCYVASKLGNEVEIPEELK